MIAEPFPTFPDEKHRFLLALVRDGGAEALVTGDAEPRRLGRSGRAIVVSVAEFVETLA